MRLSDRDLGFLVETVSPEVTDKQRLKRIIEEDEDFRKNYISDEKVFGKVMDDKEIFLKIKNRGHILIINYLPRFSLRRVISF